jgi:hypothetical protein
VNAKVELVTIFQQIEAKLPKSTLLTVGTGAVPVSEKADMATDEES